jgi:hypothetical protein
LTDSPRVLPRDPDVLPGDGDLAWAGVLFCLAVATPWLLGIGWLATVAMVVAKGIVGW